MIGLLLVNLGSPSAPTAAAVRRYLRQFLSDRRVVDLPRPLWWPILYGVVLPLRSPRTAALYRRVWTAEGAPLIRHGQALAEQVRRRVPDGHAVRLAMRYGEPSIDAALTQLIADGAKELVLVPLFPQYAEATTGSVVAEVHDWLARQAPRMPLRIVPPWFAEQGYLQAVAARCRATVAEGPPAAHWVFSFHGLPQRQVDRGDPYRRHCEATAAALASELGLQQHEWTLVFQSRFGPQPWLRPYADEIVPKLAAQHGDLVVACPGFAADCLETLDEIGEGLRSACLAAGGRSFRLVPCLNGGADLAATLVDLALRETQPS